MAVVLEVLWPTGDRQMDTVCFTPSQPRRVVSERNKMYSYQNQILNHNLMHIPPLRVDLKQSINKKTHTVEDLEELGGNEVERAWKAETR